MNISSRNLDEKRSGSFFSPMRWIGILVTMLTVFMIFCFSNPLVLSIDSTYGFLAYKGTLLFHSFNVIPEVAERDISQVTPVFVSWWSPGQWIYPALLNLLFGTHMGTAAILVTAFSLISGFIGYYRVFIFYGFSVTISTLSLLVILSGSTLYYCFIVYQGGEILEFAFFPWFLIYANRIRKISTGNLLVVGTLFLLCFIAKTTLLLYCSLALMAKVFQMEGTRPAGRYRFFFKHLLLLLPALIMITLIYIFYLSRGPRPGLIHQFGLSVEGILVPLTSPLCSILSIQQSIERIGRLGGSLSGIATAYIVVIVLYLLILAIFLYLFSRVMVNKKMDLSYKNLLCILYVGLVVFFLFAYSFNANIDFSSRHFKLMGYLFIPGCLMIVEERIRKSWIHFMLVLCCLACIVDVFYLKGKWSENRYIAEDHFYRNCSALSVKDKLDADSYKKLISIDRQISKISERPVIFFVESTADIAMELRHLYIIQSPAEDIPGRVYRGDGPGLIVCVSKNTLSAYPGFLHVKFPDYGNFQSIGETSQYFFYMNEPRENDSSTIIKRNIF